jgi:probable phosphoglycerate mutase
VAQDYQAPFSLPAGATELILVRHGASTPAGAEQRLALLGGQSDPPLAQHGHWQAERLSARLADEPVTSLFVTPLRRTVQTAAPLVGRLGLDPVEIPELREVSLGEWEADGGLQGGGPARDELRERVLREETWGIIPGAERMVAFAERVRLGLERVADLAGADRVAVAVVHGGVIAQACHQITGSRPFAFIATQNGSLTRVIRTADRDWFLLAYNDTAHLRK